MIISFRHLMILFIIILAHQVIAKEESTAKDNVPSSPKSDGSHTILRYPPGAPQLAYLRIEATITVPKPVLEALNGRITYDENYTARVSSPIAGRVTHIGAQIGESVKIGQALLHLDSPDFISAVAEARKAQNDLHQKQLAYNRANTLYEGKVLARKDLEAAESDLHQAQVELQRTQLRLKVLNPTSEKLDISERFTLRSPVDGVITERQVNLGSEIRPDLPNPLFVITDPKHLWVIIDLEEKHLGKIHPQQSVTVEVDAYPGETFSAKVTNIGNVLDATTRRIRVRCRLDNVQDRLKPEMYARITPLSDGADKVVRIPNSGLLTEGLYNFVFVETQPGVLEKRKVELEMQGRDFSFVKQGLKEGDRIVTIGAVLLNSELAGGGG